MKLIPDRWLRPRGWILVACGLLTLASAAWLGRRDLLVLALFLLLLPLIASISLRFTTPGISVGRHFSPALVAAGSPVVVQLDVTATTSHPGTAEVTEELPAQLMDVPRFKYPQPVRFRGLLSRYHYTIHPTRRGLLPIGPLRARFVDPFGVAILQRSLDSTDTLTVAPRAVPLPPSFLSSSPLHQGELATLKRTVTNADDVTTRDYRYGDSMRRVHWPATARHAKLMVREEESISDPRATLLFDQRAAGYGRPSVKLPGKTALVTNAAFEWAVTATVSIATLLLETGYGLRIIDQSGRPGFADSKSALEPQRSFFTGQPGVVAVAQALAAIELTVAGSGANQSLTPVFTSDPQDSGRGRAPGPLVAIMGSLSLDDAHSLIQMPTRDSLAAAFLVNSDGVFSGNQELPTEREKAVELLRSNGWIVTEVDPSDKLSEVWASIESVR